MIKAVLFDLDGTLLNRDASIQKFIEEQYDRLYKYVGHIQKENYTSRFIELDCRGYVWKDKVYQQLVHECNLHQISWESLLQDYLDEFKNNCIPFPYLIDMLEVLKSNSIRLGMITNGSGRFQIDTIRALGIENYFDTILISEWEGMKKPNPKIFIKAMKQLKVSPEECIFVGDHPENDVKAAQYVGMKGIWKRDPQGGNVKADFVIDDLGELLFIIKKLNKNGIGQEGKNQG